MIKAREAVPGTKLIVTGAGMSPCGGVEEVFYQVIVGRWEGQGDGSAALYDNKGQPCGRYAADHEFATKLIELVWDS